MAHDLEKDWTTKAGLRAVVLVVKFHWGKSHRCGYVEVPKTHALSGVAYGEPTAAITVKMVENLTIGKRSPITVLTATHCAMHGEPLRRSPDVLCDVHGGLTFSGDGAEGHPIKSNGWWFGFDCNHAGDGRIEQLPGFPEKAESVTRSLEYVVAECERLAEQLARPEFTAQPQQ